MYVYQAFKLENFPIRKSFLRCISSEKRVGIGAIRRRHLPRHHGNPTPPNPSGEFTPRVFCGKGLRTQTPRNINFGTTLELCESVGLSRRQLQSWLDTGLLEAETVGIPGGGHRYEFAAGQAERARVLKALHRNGVSLGRLVAADLSFDAGQAYVVYDGHELCAYRDAAAAIATVVRANWASAVDLTAMRAGVV
jgi:hypothetical protein